MSNVNGYQIPSDVSFILDIFLLNSLNFKIGAADRT